MKKLFLVGALALFSAVNAQTFGLKAGANFASVTNFSSSRTSMYGGVFMNAPLAESFSIQPELLYNGKGAKENGGTLALDYISVPVMFQYNAMPNFYLEAGPEFGFVISANEKYNGQTVNTKDTVNSFDIGIGLGAGYYFTPQIGLTARYVAGMTDIAKNNPGNDKYKNNVFQVGLAYKFAK